MPSNPKSRGNGEGGKNANVISDRSQEPRFGFTNVGDTTVSKSSLFFEEDLTKVYKYVYNVAGIINLARTLIIEELKNDWTKFRAFFGRT